ncbi:MAG TPA: flavin reductase family protein [Nocardioidaceae bacterium]|nr:flavin reductase family protein [Nocardioidaceae bacterium]
MTIHSEHPFLPPESDRSAVRRLRGRLASGVTLWASSSGERPAGLTVSSMLVADGEPGRVVALLDPDSELWAAAAGSRTVAVSWLTYDDRLLADAFAGVAPAPGGPFKLADWQHTEWGPVLATATTWAGCRLVDDEPREVGWALLAEAVLEHIELGDEQAPPLAHRRGRYLRLE